MNKLRLLLFSFALISFTRLQAQEHIYIAPTDSLVKKNLAEWQGYKFGLLMHWGTYSQWGIVESWSLCPEDEDWCQRKGPYAANYFEYKKKYEELQHSFNPIQFNPDKWASAAAYAGMKYIVFTTKHHDGFCMFDTKLTDYKVTSPNCAFAFNPKANIADEVFKAFRKKDFKIGAYFSKPDWHCENYWSPYFPPLDRNPNYAIDKHPEWWKAYTDFTHGQINELLSNYGKIDILWLDGGWVRPDSLDKYKSARIKNNQDINMDLIAKNAQQKQAGIIVVDRDVPTKNQNYLTPEQKLPDTLLPYPWETCMTMATSWSWVPNDQYKSSEELIQTLCKIVSRGGNFLLNVAPNPFGELDSTAYVRLREIGNWMKVNGSAIYESKPVFPYKYKNMVFTQRGNSIYVIVLKSKATENLPSEIELPVFKINHQLFKSAKLLGNESIRIKLKNNKLFIPNAIACRSSAAWVIQLN